MHYEIHITVFVTNIEKFKKDCLELGVKPILIETEHPNGFNDQVMTSSKHYWNNYDEKDWKFTLDELSSKLEDMGYEILRKKVEKKPENRIDNNHVYFETHFRLKLENNKEEDIAKDYKHIRNLCDRYNLHLSKNLLKKEKGYIYQMMTYRDYSKNFGIFERTIGEVKNNMWGDRYINCDKLEIEECIYDSNVNIDNSWFNG